MQAQDADASRERHAGLTRVARRTPHGSVLRVRLRSAAEVEPRSAGRAPRIAHSHGAACGTVASQASSILTDPVAHSENGNLVAPVATSQRYPSGSAN